LWQQPGQRHQERKFFCFFFFKKRSAYKIWPTVGVKKSWMPAFAGMMIWSGG
jgi:hypothetical protein